MKILKMTSLSLIGLVTLTSCISQKKYAELQNNYQVCIERNAEKDRAISSLQERNKSLEIQYQNALNQQKGVQNALTECLSMAKGSNVNIQKLLEQAKVSQEYIKQLTDARFKNDSLNLAISNKLKRSLDNLNDEDVNVQVQKGVVFISLSDNMLYKSGSYEVLPTAEQVLEKVAKVINDYKDYDIQVQGYTDTDPYKSNSCIKDNWDLSVLRATSIVRILQNKFGVNPARMLAGGHSEYQPKTTNSTSVGKAANRRTEIVILPKLDQFMKLVEEGATNKK